MAHKGVSGEGRYSRLGVLVALLASICLLAAPAGADAYGQLTYEQCFGNANGCIGAGDGDLSEVNVLALSPDGGLLYAAGKESISQFSTDPVGGQLSFNTCVGDDTVFHFPACVADASSAKPLKLPLSVVVDPKGGVYATSVESNDVVQLYAGPGSLAYGGCVSADGSGGLCESAQREAAVFFGAGDSVVSPDGNHLYVAAGGSPMLPEQGGVLVLSVTEQGQIHFEGCITTTGSNLGCRSTPGNDSLIGTTSVAISPDGKWLYSMSSGSVTRFRIELDGQLSYVECIGEATGCAPIPSPGALENVRRLAVSPDGRSLYATATMVASGEVSHIELDAGGAMSWRGCLSSAPLAGCTPIANLDGEALRAPRGLAVSPDGRSLYVGSHTGISSFTIGAGGDLAFQSCLTEAPLVGCSTVGGAVANVAALTVSPTGGSVYGASGDGAVLHFIRSVSGETGTMPTTGPGGTGGGGGGLPAGLTVAAIRASLLAQLAPSGKAAKLGAVLRKKGYSYPFTVFTAGRLTVDWYYLPRGAHLSKAAKKKPKPVLVAGGAVSFAHAGTMTVVVRLTRRGQALLRHTGTLSAKATFKPTGASAISAVKRFVLRR